jgi:hypothetical protein
MSKYISIALHEWEVHLYSQVMNIIFTTYEFIIYFPAELLLLLVLYKSNLELFYTGFSPPSNILYKTQRNNSKIILRGEE